MGENVEDFLPLTPQTFYVMISLRKERYGYAIMQDVEKLTSERMQLGPGTLYGILTKLENSHLIAPSDGNSTSRRKNYQLTSLGIEVVLLEFERLEKMVNNTQKFVQEMRELL